MDEEMKGYFTEETDIGFFLCKKYKNQIIKSEWKIEKRFIEFVRNAKYKYLTYDHNQGEYYFDNDKISIDLKNAIDRQVHRTIKQSCDSIDKQIMEIELIQRLDENAKKSQVWKKGNQEKIMNNE